MVVVIIKVFVLSPLVCNNARKVIIFFLGYAILTLNFIFWANLFLSKYKQIK